MTEKEIVKLREILGRIARRSEHKVDLGLIKALALEADNLVKESDSLPCVISWVAFDWIKIETRPKEYGKYLITRKDGKIHWETWNGSGWAYNHNEIRYWAEIKPPCL